MIQLPRSVERTRPEPPPLEVLTSNVQPLAIWRDCAKPFQIGGLGSVMPAPLETVEIREVCDTHETRLTPQLLRRIRHLDDAYRDERIKQINEKSSRIR